MYDDMAYDTAKGYISTFAEEQSPAQVVDPIAYVQKV